MLKKRWFTVQMTYHPLFSFQFLTALSAQQWCYILVEKHCTVHQSTWILHLAQPQADTDLEQVFTPHVSILYIQDQAGSYCIWWGVQCSMWPGFKASCKSAWGTIIVNALQRGMSVQARGGRICSSFSRCCCSSATQGPTVMVCLGSTARTGNQSTSCVLSQLQLCHFRPSGKGAWWQRCNVECHVQHQTISSLFRAFWIYLSWS